MPRTVSILAALALGCGGPADTAPPIIISVAPCGDVDGTGGDTGDVPDVIGLWTSTFGSELIDSTCTLSGQAVDHFPWLNTPFEIAGSAPTGLRLENDGLDGYLFGVESSTGGMVFSGQSDSADGTLHVAVSGLVYQDTIAGRTIWDGMVFIGIDDDGDNNIDCTVRGNWTGIKSG